MPEGSIRQFSTRKAITGSLGYVPCGKVCPMPDGIDLKCDYDRSCGEW